MTAVEVRTRHRFITPSMLGIEHIGVVAEAIQYTGHGSVEVAGCISDYIRIGALTDVGFVNGGHLMLRETDLVKLLGDSEDR